MKPVYDGAPSVGSRLGRLLGSTERVMSGAASGGILLIMALGAAGVVSRMFSWALPGGIEAMRNLMAAVVFLGLAYTQAQNRHIRMDIIEKRFPPRLRLIVGEAVLLISVILFAIVTGKTGQIAYDSWQMREVDWGLIAFPIYPFKMLLPFAFAVLTVRIAVQFVTNWTGRHARRTE